MANISMMAAINLALHEAMDADKKVICVGEDMSKKGGSWGYFAGPKYKLAEEFGEDRILDMPIAESGYSAMSVGMAIGGYRPVVEYMFADFSTLGTEAIIDMAAKLHFYSAKKNNAAITFIMPQGGGGRSGGHHSQSVEAWWTNVPGLKVVAPTTPADVRAFLLASIKDDDPVVFIFQRALLGSKGEVPDTPDTLPSLGNAGKIVKEGKDVTVVAYHRELNYAIEAAAEVEKETGRTVEIIDPRVLVPFDKKLVADSVKKTGRLVVVHQAPTNGGYGNQIISYAMEEAATFMKANPKLIGSKNCVIPFGRPEDFIYPTKEDIKNTIIEMIK
jgi:Pyruvate/2-oxoglutarate dehydrogenase complex, dehydrogenase (E1) component, eukaryotic type, beta subunit